MQAETRTTPRLNLTPELARQLFDQVCRHVPAGAGVEIMLNEGISELTRFANNAITQNVAEQQTSLSIRTVLDRRMARSSTNRLDAESIRAAVERALSLTRLQEPDPEALPLPGPQRYPAVQRSFASTAAVTPEERAAVVGDMVRVANQAKLTSAGTYSTSQSASALLNSAGLEAFYEDTSAEFSVTMLAGNSSGWAKGNHPDVHQIDPVGATRRAAEKARASADPMELLPGAYTVILEPAAALDLLGFLFWDFSALSVLDQRSCLTGRTGEKLFGDNITVHDDAYHPLQTGAPFDGEGIPRQRVALIDSGRAANLVYARTTAERWNQENAGANARATGHGFPLPNEYGEAPMNIVIAGGETSLEEMIATTGRGILVTRLWYIREVDPFPKILTGMTRDGTFLVEDGKIGRGLRNFRFNQSAIELLNNVVALSAPVRASGEESFDMVVPAMKVNNFNFTEVTRF